MVQIKAVQAQEFQLAGSGITSTATTIVLKSFKLVDGTTNITMTDVGLIGFMTLEPGSSREEQIKFTGVTQNADGTATLTGVTRGINFVSPYDEISAYKKSHGGSTTAILSNTSGFEGNIKDYIDAIAISGAPDASTTTKGLVEEATLAEVDAGTGAGATGARLFVNPQTSSTQLFTAAQKTQVTQFSVSGIISPYIGKTAPTGWLMCDGSAVSRSTYASLFAVISPSGTVTVTIASPGVFTKTAHGYVVGDKVHFTTTGALPTGLSVNTDYFIIAGGLTANAFEVAITPGGAAVNTSGSQSGVHTIYLSSFGKGDGSSTFNVPDFRSRSLVGFSASAPTTTLSFEAASVSAVNDNVTILDTVFPSQGQKVQLTTTGTLPAGLSLATDYYIIRQSATTIQFATGLANISSLLVNITDQGSGIHTMTFTNRAHTVLGRSGGEENHSISLSELASHTHTTAFQLLGSSTAGGSNLVKDGATNTGSSGLDSPHNNMSPFAVINYIIKT